MPPLYIPRVRGLKSNKTVIRGIKKFLPNLRIDVKGRPAPHKHVASYACQYLRGYIDQRY